MFKKHIATTMTRMFYKKTKLAVTIALALCDLAYAEDKLIHGSSSAVTLSNGDNLLVEPAGSVNVTEGKAINVTGSATITNSGTISALADTAVSVPTGPYDVTITNKVSGIITGNDTAIFAQVINRFNFANDGTINGDITTGPVISELLFENNNTINGGVNLSGSSVDVTNNGTILAATTGLAVSSTNGSITITNNGNIKIANSDALGIGAIDAKGTTSINNAGIIDSGSADGLAITGDKAAKQTVNIYTGSKINGVIDLAIDAEQDAVEDLIQDEINIYDDGSKGSYQLAIKHQQTTDINIKPSSNAVRLPNKDNTALVAVVNATGAALHPVRLDYLSSKLHGIIRDRVGHLKVNKPVKVAALRLSPEMLHYNNGAQLWGRVFGERTNRDAEGAVSAYENELTGFVGGYQYAVGKGDLGVVVGFAKSTFTTNNNNQDDDINSAYIGAYAQTHFGKLNLIGSLIVGQQSHDNRRKVAGGSGTEIAKSDNSSVFLSPSVTLSSSVKLNEWFTLRPSSSLTYSIGRYDDYKETGVGDANIKGDARTTDAASANMQLQLAYAVAAGEINVTAGLQARYSDNEDIDLSIAGNDFSYKSGIDSTVSGGYVGAGADIALDNGLNLVIDTRYGEFSGGERQLGGQVQLQYSF